VLEYKLDTLTNRKEEYEFEHFVRQLAERELCANLLPQTGPTGGGDSQVDTDTYPVADSISIRWYEGIGREAHGDRWAFAFSAKKKWASKAAADVQNIVATNRGYKVVYFITNQFVPDKARARTEDKLRVTHGVDVRILDRSWIVERAFRDDLLQVAIDALHLDSTVATRKEVGPRDLERETELAALDQRP
jgi:hypothetical protein